MASTKNPTPDNARPSPANEGRDTPPSPPERHPGKKPEEAGGDFEDLKTRDRGNHR